MMRFGVLAGASHVLGAQPGQWTKGDAANAVHPIFMLKHAQDAVDAFEATVQDVSTPGHHLYGHHLTSEQVKAALPVPPASLAAVENYLHAHQVDYTISPGGDMVTADIPAAIASRMFDAEFHSFSHPRSVQSIDRAVAGFTVPDEIEDHVYLVGNLNEFPAVMAPLVTDAPAAGFGADCTSCTGKVTPGVLAERYEIAATGATGANIRSMATAEFQGVDWDQADLDFFSKSCSLGNVTVANQIGANSPSKCKIPLMGFQSCAEALLDIEYAKAVIKDLPLTNIFNSQYSLLTWAQQVDALGDSGPSVHSVSYGNDEVQQTSAAFMQSVNAQLMKLAAKGVSVLFASGDQGTCGRTGCSGSSPKYNPDFPAGSPYVTAVGGTDFATAGVVGDEKAWTGGGGGFSNTFPAPAWQQKQVAAYLKSAKGLPAGSQYNATGRAYPDVAALAGQQNPYCVAGHMFIGSKMTGIAGTSAACPVFAGIVTRVNAELQAKGKSPLGLLNPWIYQHPEMFHDVTLGSNNAGGGGFPASAGWDPATGMGTPIYSKMLTAALSDHEVEIVV